MVTVATSLDVPIKLLFPRPARPDADPTKQALAMLGLGDVVIPGIMIGLAIRYDLHLHYARKQKNLPGDEKTESSHAMETSKPRVQKSSYHTATGLWGERFWLSSSSTSLDIAPLTGGQFSKVYFNASLVGYIVGMLATFTAMHISNHAQPALLYLVPGVLGALWGTALARGEILMMWNFSEAVEEDTKEDTKEKPGDGDKDAKKEEEAPGSEDKVAEKEEEEKKTSYPNSKLGNKSLEDNNNGNTHEGEILEDKNREDTTPTAAEPDKNAFSTSTPPDHPLQDRSNPIQIFSLTITAPSIPTATLQRRGDDTTIKKEEALPSSLDTNGIPVGKRRRV
jgi:minor histocompatibility antigen H13